MEKTLLVTFSFSLSITNFDGFLFFHRILNWVIRLQGFHFIFLSFLQSQLEFLVRKLKFGDKKQSHNLENMSTHQVCLNKKERLELRREEIEMVMGKLGFSCNPENENFKEILGFDHEISLLFEEEEPSLDEIKEAFGVFDENRDGFIDAKELHRVLSNLGFLEGSNIDACERMIKGYDKNGDGRIDFIEFVKLMEDSFC